MFNFGFKIRMCKSCISDVENLVTFQARLRIGMYHIFIEDWWRVYPKDQILILKFEDYKRNSKDSLNRVFKFLELRK